MDNPELARRFVYHPPEERTRALHDGIRELVIQFVRDVDDAVEGDSSREMSLFYTAIEEASFWLHAHVARNR